MSALDITDRWRQDELLQMRNDLMTVLREIGEDDPRLFPLRYARTGAGSAAAARARRREGVDGPQVPILLLPDGPGSASVIPYDLLRRLMNQRGLDVIMPEHRGVGLSRLDADGRDLPKSAMRVREVLGDLVAVLDHARAERAVVYGTGYGAYLALAFGALHPERVHSLVLDSPLVSAQDEVIAQRALREAYWEGSDPQTADIARMLRRLVAHDVIDGRRAGPVLLAAHDHGGAQAVRELVELLAVGRGRLTWTSIRQFLTRSFLQNAPYVHENDLVARIAHTELGRGRHADGGPVDALQLLALQARTVEPFAGEPVDLWSLASSISAPTLVLSGERDLVCPPQIARDLADRIPDGHLLSIAGTGHSILDTHAAVASIAARWSAAGAGHLLPQRAEELSRLPRTPVDQALSQGLRLALLAERLSPWTLWLETARSRRAEASRDPRGRRARRRRAV